MQILAVLLNKCLQIHDDDDDDDDDDHDDHDDNDDDDDDGDEYDHDDNGYNDDDEDDNDEDPPGKPQHCPSPASPTPRQLTAKVRMRLH